MTTLIAWLIMLCIFIALCGVFWLLSLPMQIYLRNRAQQITTPPVVVVVQPTVAQPQCSCIGVVDPQCQQHGGQLTR